MANQKRKAVKLARIASYLDTLSPQNKKKPDAQHRAFLDCVRQAERTKAPPALSHSKAGQQPDLHTSLRLKAFTSGLLAPWPAFWMHRFRPLSERATRMLR